MKKVQFTFCNELHKQFKTECSFRDETMQEMATRLIELTSFGLMKDNEKQNVCDKFRKILNQNGGLGIECLNIFNIKDIEKEEENLLMKTYEEEVKELIGNIYIVSNGEYHGIIIVKENFCFEDSYPIKRLYFKY